MSKICRDCRYSTGHISGSLCTHPLALKSVDIVTGAEDRRTAREMRKDVTLCGGEGLLFEALVLGKIARLRKMLAEKYAG